MSFGIFVNIWYSELDKDSFVGTFISPTPQVLCEYSLTQKSGPDFERAYLYCTGRSPWIYSPACDYLGFDLSFTYGQILAQKKTAG